jgi:hypothetical protein
VEAIGNLAALRVDILPDVRQFAISNASGERLSDVPCCDVFHLERGKVTSFHCYNATSYNAATTWPSHRVRWQSRI